MFNEIVGAIIDSFTVTDRARIEASMLLGKSIRYITRHEAVRKTLEDPSRRWKDLAQAPTLFVTDNGVRFRSQCPWTG
jgi:hypothetical protein